MQERHTRKRLFVEVNFWGRMGSESNRCLCLGQSEERSPGCSVDAENWRVHCHTQNCETEHKWRDELKHMHKCVCFMKPLRLMGSTEAAHELIQGQNEPTVGALQCTMEQWSLEAEKLWCSSSFCDIYSLLFIDVTVAV